MKLRNFISLVLLSVYLFAVSAPAFASLSCHCIGEKQIAGQHMCCNHGDHCSHEGDLLAAKADLAAPCCSDHHSTEITLYTGSAFEGDRLVKCAVVCLPPSLAVECPCPEHTPLRREKTAEQRAPFVQEACVLPSGFRAPPVLA